MYLCLFKKNKMIIEGNVGDIYSTKTSLLPTRNWKSVIHDECMRKFNFWIMITENKSKLWKRWVAKQYRDGQLIASFPANSLKEIDLSFFVK